jgi:hypothetical protein
MKKLLLVAVAILASCQSDDSPTQPTAPTGVQQDMLATRLRTTLDEGRVIVFGPGRFYRDAGQPVEVEQTLATRYPEAFEGPFVIHVRNGGEDGAPAASAKISVDGDVVFGPDEFNQNVDYLESQLVISEASVLEVEVTSGTGSYMDVWVSGIPRGPPASVSEHARAIDIDTEAALISATADVSVLKFSRMTPLLAVLSPGDILISGTTALTPYGFLQKVTSVVEAGNEVRVETVPAAFEDVFEEATIPLDFRIRLEDVRDVTILADGVELLTELPASSELSEPTNSLRADENAVTSSAAAAQLVYSISDVALDPSDVCKANGSLSVGLLSLEGDVELRGWRPNLIALSGTLGGAADIVVQCSADLEFIDHKKELISFAFAETTVLVGGWPVVVTPTATVEVRLKGTVELGALLSFDAVTEVSGGFSWTATDGLDFFGDYSQELGGELRPTAALQLRGSIGVPFSVLFYRFVGPFAGLELFGEGSADLYADPWWELYAGIAAPMGFKVRAWSRTLAEASAVVAEYRTLVAEAGGPFGEGQFAGRVIDATNGQGIVNAQVDFSGRQGVLESVLSGPDGGYLSPPLPVGSYDVEVSSGGYVSTQLQDAEVVAWEVTTLETIPLVPESPFPGAVSGRILDASSVAPIDGAEVELREGINATDGPYMASTVSSQDGGYRFGGIPAGTYTVFARATGFSEGFRTGIVIGDSEVPYQDVILSGSGQSDEFLRIVLTWGDSPSDLDSHLTGPLTSGDRFHVFFANRGSLTSEPFAELDVDDVTSFGPETITVSQVSPGLYRYSVHDFTNLNSSSSNALGFSSAKVEVYRGTESLGRFFVPQAEGTLWTVFEYEDGTLRPINSMSYQSAPSGVPVVDAAPPTTDGALIGASVLTNPKD